MKIYEYRHTADSIYPAHGIPFPTSDIAKYKKYFSDIHLRKLN